MSGKILITLLVLLLLVLGIAFIFGDFDGEVNQNVALEATSLQPSYNQGDKVTINIKLTNLGEGDICLSEGALGNLSFKSFTKDGEDPENRSATSYFLTSLSEILKSRLVSVAPGESLELSIASEVDPGLEVQALRTTEPKDSTGTATFYNVEEPGLYELELEYEYKGESSADCENVLKGSVVSSTTTFTIDQVEE